ncbi:hypothetical protein, partial [Empedobacter stercoris]|uniref:hypothetical protein n=1 Tax=Empedobacter stercoris TaxID=1628248 RepID=UPI001C8780EB
FYSFSFSKDTAWRLSFCVHLKVVTPNLNWHTVLLTICKRRGVEKLYNKNVDDIENLPKFIFEKENAFWKKLKRRFL